MTDYEIECMIEDKIMDRMDYDFGSFFLENLYWGLSINDGHREQLVITYDWAFVHQIIRSIETESEENLRAVQINAGDDLYTCNFNNARLEYRPHTGLVEFYFDSSDYE